MEGKLLYVCPNHSEIVLWEEETDGKQLRMIRFDDHPRECKKCKKSYFKRECDLRMQ